MTKTNIIIDATDCGYAVTMAPKLRFVLRPPPGVTPVPEGEIGNYVDQRILQQWWGEIGGERGYWIDVPIESEPHLEE